MSGEIERRKEVPYWEVSIVGIFRAVDREKAHMFVRRMAILLQETGLDEVGWDFRPVSGGDVTDQEAAKIQLLNDTWRPEWGPKPWESERAQKAAEILKEPFSEDPTHDEVMERLRASRKELEAGDAE